MKANVVFLFCLFCSITIYGQNAVSLKGISFTPPKFTGVQTRVLNNAGQAGMTIEEYLAKTIVFPQDAITHYAQGTEVISFVVTEKGELTDFKVINSVSPSIDQAVIDALQTTQGMWNPGYTIEDASAMVKEYSAQEKEVSVIFKQAEHTTAEFKVMAKKHYAHGAETLFTDHNPVKALKFFDKGIVLLPKDKCLLLLRGLTRYEMGDRNGALADWNRIKNLGGLDKDQYIDEFINMNGYRELTQLLAK